MFWYGKLPKVGIYHQAESAFYDNKDIFENPLIQSDFNPSNKTKNKGADEFVVFLLNNKEFVTNANLLDVPIFDGKKIIGSKSLQGLMLDELTKYQENNLKK